MLDSAPVHCILVTISPYLGSGVRYTAYSATGHRVWIEWGVTRLAHALRGPSQSVLQRPQCGAVPRGRLRVAMGETLHETRQAMHSCTTRTVSCVCMARDGRLEQRQALQECAVRSHVWCRTAIYDITMVVMCRGGASYFPSKCCFSVLVTFLHCRNSGFCNRRREEHVEFALVSSFFA